MKAFFCCWWLVGFAFVMGIFIGRVPPNRKEPPLLSQTVAGLVVLIMWPVLLIAFLKVGFDDLGVQEIEIADISEEEQRLDNLFLEAFDTNHPAMHDWVRIKFALKEAREQKNSDNDN